METLLDRGYKVNVFDVKKTFQDARARFFIGDLCNKEVSTEHLKLCNCSLASQTLTSCKGPLPARVRVMGPGVG